MIPRRTAIPNPWDIGFGIVMVLFALGALIVWFPLDIKGSFIETNQVGRTGPGDAFFPTILASAILALSAVQILLTFMKTRAETSGRISRANIVFLIGFHLIAGFGLVAMYVLGPAVVTAINAVQGSSLSYRELVDTVPYKYVGYIVGGCLLTLPIIIWAEGRLRVRSVIVVLTVIAVSIVIFDLLLSNVQLPPNIEY
ncbi:MAG: hypothetical protein AAF346_21420 [Pseudomonadota bacterium]